ncbi:MAG TPA: NBR1-Ig-like domain-containing protein [Candidatus Sulfotelmatobacter sp.]|nr:NBR1-Ig-like domain-containing protein [Candidatus Sulfotelmatobacter sp.]
MNLNAIIFRRFYSHFVVFSMVGMFLGASRAFAGDSAALLYQSVTNGTWVTPRSIYAQTWTFTNNGTTTWTPTASGYTLNLIGLDSLGLIQTFTNNGWLTISSIIGSGKDVAPGKTATFSIDFIAPEAAGSYTDSFQLNGTNFFGPVVTIQVNVPDTGNTNVYDRCRAVSFANNYVQYFCPDGYFWYEGCCYLTTNADSFIGVPVDVSGEDDGIGDDCAHFVSYCIGKGPYVRGGGIPVPTYDPPTYGDPAAPTIVQNDLLDSGYAVQVSSLSQMEPGDVVGWYWGTGDTNIGDIDHVTLYMGNNMFTCHAASALDVDADYFNGTSYVWHLIHILDYPTLWTSRSGSSMTFMWTTNWSGYALYTNKSLTGTWGKISTKPTVIGITNSLKVTLPGASAVFYRLEMP